MRHGSKHASHQLIPIIRCNSISVDASQLTLLRRRWAHYLPIPNIRINVIHIYKDYYPSRDPDGRAEVLSLCGQWEECSGSGRHSMVGPETTDCPDCIKIYLSEFDYFWEKTDEKVSKISALPMAETN